MSWAASGSRGATRPGGGCRRSWESQHQSRACRRGLLQPGAAKAFEIVIAIGLVLPG